MLALFRAVALGVLVLALILNVVGFVTNSWISAKLDSRGIDDIMSANGMGDYSPKQTVGLAINLGLWKFCIHANMGKAMAGMAGSSIDMCQSVQSAGNQIPGWMKAVQALGILSIITTVMAIACVIYSFIGDSKGDRARLLPHMMSGVSLLAGVLLLIAVIVYGVEYDKMMQNQITMMGNSDPTFGPLAANLKQNTSLGYSFVLEAIAGVLMVLVSVLLVAPVLRAGGGSSFGGPHNLAV